MLWSFSFSKIFQITAKKIIEKDVKQNFFLNFCSTLFLNDSLARDREAIFPVVLSVLENRQLYTLVLLMEITKDRIGENRQGKEKNLQSAATPVLTHFVVSADETQLRWLFLFFILFHFFPLSVLFFYFQLILIIITHS